MFQRQRYRRGVLLGFGALALLVGAVWIGQGTGVFPYPASSFMVDDPAWAFWGAALAILGLATIVAGIRR